MSDPFYRSPYPTHRKQPYQPQASPEKKATYYNPLFGYIKDDNQKATKSKIIRYNPLFGTYEDKGKELEDISFDFDEDQESRQRSPKQMYNPLFGTYKKTSPNKNEPNKKYNYQRNQNINKEEKYQNYQQKEIKSDQIIQKNEMMHEKVQQRDQGQKDQDFMHQNRNKYSKFDFIDHSGQRNFNQIQDKEAYNQKKYKNQFIQQQNFLNRIQYNEISYQQEYKSQKFQKQYQNNFDQDQIQNKNQYQKNNQNYRKNSQQIPNNNQEPIKIQQSNIYQELKGSNEIMLETLKYIPVDQNNILAGKIVTFDEDQLMNLIEDKDEKSCQNNSNNIQNQQSQQNIDNQNQKIQNQSQISEVQQFNQKNQSEDNINNQQAINQAINTDQQPEQDSQNAQNNIHQITNQIQNKSNEQIYQKNKTILDNLNEILAQNSSKQESHLLLKYEQQIQSQIQQIQIDKQYHYKSQNKGRIDSFKSDMISQNYQNSQQLRISQPYQRSKYQRQNNQNYQQRDNFDRYQQQGYQQNSDQKRNYNNECQIDRKYDNSFQNISYINQNPIQKIKYELKEDVMALVLNSDSISYKFKHEFKRTKYDDFNNIVKVFPHLESLSFFDYFQPEQHANIRCFIIRSVGEDDIHKAIKYGVWTSHAKNNLILEKAYEESLINNQDIILFFTVMGSERFQGVARMISGFKDTRFKFWLNSEIFFQTFDIEWMFIKDIHFKWIEDLFDCQRQRFIVQLPDCSEFDYFTVGIEFIRRFQYLNFDGCIFDYFHFYDIREDKIIELIQLKTQIVSQGIQQKHEIYQHK